MELITVNKEQKMCILWDEMIDNTRNRERRNQGQIRCLECKFTNHNNSV